ncbi:hypothetical protein L9F63_017686, partial [Diploptera punctata]
WGVINYMITSKQLLERRRRFEEERKSRIFNARQRLIGVDLQCLEKQIREHKLQQQVEHKKDEAFHAQQVQDAEQAIQIERKIREEKRRLNEDINTFRAVYQRPETRREFDLYDPDGLKKSLPARLLDDDPRCGPSSAQKFEGEDLSSKERLKAQRDQFRAWLEQQVAERKAADNDRKAAQAAFDAALIARDKRACELDKLEQECRKRLDEATYRFNKALAEEQSLKCSVEQAKELEDKFAEIYNHLTGDFLTENPDVANSNLGSSRKIGYLYRGMTPEEREAVRKEQLKQMQENKEKQKAEQQLEDLMRKQRELNVKILEQNKRLSEEQTRRQKYLNDTVYTNEPTAAYYDQFNTTTR